MNKGSMAFPFTGGERSDRLLTVWHPVSRVSVVGWMGSLVRMGGLPGPAKMAVMINARARAHSYFLS